MMLLLGGTVLAIFVLILGAFILQRYLSHTLNPQEPKPPRLRVDDEAAFTLATVKGVVTELKSAQKAAQEKLLAAERRAEENARKFELLAGEIDYGLMIFDADGFVTFSNPRARKVLAVDTWSRRRYGEVFRDIPELSGLIGECFEAGTEVRKKTVEFQGSDGNTRRVEVSVLPTRDRSGVVEGVACLCREVAPAAPDA